MIDYKGLITSLSGPLRRAHAQYDAAINPKPVDRDYLRRSADLVLAEPSGSPAEPSRNDTMETLRKLRREVTNNLVASAPYEDSDRPRASSDGSDVGRGPSSATLGNQESLSLLLLIWLGQFFNGTPRPEVWQMIADYVDRFGGGPTLAFVMKAYGDIYRVERRRWKEYERFRTVAWREPKGIITVVRHSVLIEPDAYLLIEEKSLKGELPDGGRTWLPQLAAIANESSEAYLRTTALALTERMARLYCAIQVLWYSRGSLPIKVIWRDWGAAPSEQNRRRFDITLPNPECQCLVLVPEREKHDEPLRHLCVLNSNGGVVRDLNESLANPAGRFQFSQRHKDLYEALKKYVENRPDEDFHVPAGKRPSFAVCSASGRIARPDA